MIMKRIVCLIFLVSSCCFAGDLTTLDGKTYRNITVTRVEADGLVVTHTEGGCKIDFLNLPEDVRKKYSYDPAKAEAAKKAAASATKAAGSWQEMDQRMIFLTVQLSSVEASLAALNRALISLGINQVARQSAAAVARQANEAMDRNAGGPVPWADFYGHTAEKFFYHPIDIHTHYHTWTILGLPPSGKVAPGQGVPPPQGLPVHQRPPQFDYIYRANADAERRAQAEVARLGNNGAAILERRRQLETEQSALWCKIAFHAVAGRELLSKPLYYYDLKSAESDTAEGRQRLEALRAAMVYLRNVNRLAAMVEQGVDADAARCYSQLQEGVGVARGEMERRLMAQPVLVDNITDSRTMLGRFVAVAKRMGEVSANITDAHRLALDGDRAGDQGRKQTFRSQLQQSLMLCAEALLAGDECVNELARDWKAQPDMQTPAPASVTVQAMLVVPEPRPVETPTVQPSSLPAAGAMNGGEVELQRIVATLKQSNPGFKGSSKYKIENGRVVELSIHGQELHDLSALRGMALTLLDCSSSHVESLEPLRGMRLETLDCYYTKVNDLSPLKGMPLRKLWMTRAPVSDLSPLKGIPLMWLTIKETKVSDLEPLRGMQLQFLNCERTKISDLSVLQTMPIEEIRCDIRTERDKQILAGIKTLGKINGHISSDILGATPPFSNPATISTQTLPADDPAWSHAVNLMPLIDPARDAVKGIWKLQEGKLMLESSSYARIQIPYEPPAEYDFRIILRRVAGMTGVAQFFSHTGRAAMWLMGGRSNTAFGFQMVDGIGVPHNRTSILKKNCLETGRDYTSILQVRNDGVKAFLDGKLISEWTTDFSDAGLERVWNLPDERFLALGCSMSSFEFYKIDLLEITGKGRTGFQP